MNVCPGKFPGLSANFFLDVVLSNLTAGYVHPCVMDIKLGQKNYVENGTLSPMTVQKRKIKCAATTASQLGFRISGMRVRRFSLFSANFFLVDFRNSSCNKEFPLEFPIGRISFLFKNRCTSFSLVHCPVLKF